MSRSLIKNGHIVTVNGNREVLPGGAVVVANGRIESVHSAAPVSGSRDFDEVIDAEGCLVMPGLINLHQHHWYCLFKGIADGMLLEDWISGLVFPLVSKLSPDAQKVLKVLRKEWEMGTSDLRAEAKIADRPKLKLQF